MITYLCKTNNGGREVRGWCPTPVIKRKSSLKYIFGQGNHEPTGNRQFLRWNARENVSPALSF